jgi:hypothetical protein
LQNRLQTCRLLCKMRWSCWLVVLDPLLLKIIMLQRDCCDIIHTVHAYCTTMMKKNHSFL